MVPIFSTAVVHTSW